MTKMEILLKITPAVSIVRKLTPKMEEKRQNRGSLSQQGTYRYYTIFSQKEFDLSTIQSRSP